MVGADLAAENGVHLNHDGGGEELAPVGACLRDGTGCRVKRRRLGLGLERELVEDVKITAQGKSQSESSVPRIDRALTRPGLVS